MIDTKLIPQSEIKKCLTMNRAINLVEKIYTAYGNGTVIMPAKINIPMGLHEGEWPPYNANITSLPAFIHYADDNEVLGMKWIWAYYNNKRDYDLPWCGALIVLNTPKNGEPLAIMDGTYISDMRTGAATACAARKLANSNPKKIVSLFGAGMQGRMHAHSLSNVFDIAELKIYDKYPEAAKAFASNMKEELDLSITVSGSMEENCKGADVIVTCSIANEPLVDFDWLKKGCTVISVGSYIELADNVFKADKLYVDSWAQICKKGKGDIGPRVENGTLTKDQLTGEIPLLLAGKVVGRESENEIILVNMIGMGILDVGVAGDLYKNDFANCDAQTFRFV